MSDKEFFRTTSVTDFQFKPGGEAPEGYPTEKVSDSFSYESFSHDWETRRKAYLNHVMKNPSTVTVKGIFYELVRLHEDTGPIHYGNILGALEYIDSRKDCADFTMTGVLRMMYQLADKPQMTEELKARAKKTILDFKYWPDEPGIDSMCYWTENHHILFSVDEYLAGQLYPDEVFTNSGMKGAEKRDRAAIRIEKWLELRFKAGFSEWLSNVYYDEDLPALLNLLDFGGSEKLADQARAVIDLMVYDMALNTFHGQFVCSHGRTYTKEKKSALDESTTDTTKLLFGMGVFALRDNMSAVQFALSEKYRMPEIFYRIANDLDRGEMVNFQRHSIRFKDARKWGYVKADLRTAMGLLSYGGYSHPGTIDHMVRMLDGFNWWENNFFREFGPFRKAISMGKYFGLTKLIAWIFRKDLSRNAMTEANILTYRTPDYMLSTAQDYRKGYGGDQHHIWQATLGLEAVCFTTHPGGYTESAPDAYWHGNGFMPRSVQVKNVNISIYNMPGDPTILLGKKLDFTHAWLPKSKFDEVVEKNRWIFARKGNGYLALYSSGLYKWQEEGENKDCEVIVPGKSNIWITELGRKAVNGSFDEFIDSVSRSEIKVKGLQVSYHSPTQGRLELGWKGPFKQNGKFVSLKDYPRYENPYGYTLFGEDRVELSEGNEKLEITL